MIPTDVIARLQVDYPDLRFRAGSVYYWSPRYQVIEYKDGDTRPSATWTLLHEAGHAILGHKQYGSDIELLKLEAEAWEQALRLARRFSITIDPDHVQDCLDTYRDWLHARSTCPVCEAHSTQSDATTYRCFNCGANWHVSASRFCRTHRRVIRKVTT
jgi:hypothetical protein